MTLICRCDGCGRGLPQGKNGANPVDPETGQKWFSREIDGVEQNACSRECLRKVGGIVAPW